MMTKGVVLMWVVENVVLLWDGGCGIVMGGGGHGIVVGGGGCGIVVSGGGRGIVVGGGGCGILVCTILYTIKCGQAPHPTHILPSSPPQLLPVGRHQGGQKDRNTRGDTWKNIFLPKANLSPFFFCFEGKGTSWPPRQK